jgi:hypothetical protein
MCLCHDILLLSYSWLGRVYHVRSSSYIMLEPIDDISCVICRVSQVPYCAPRQTS